MSAILIPKNPYFAVDRETVLISCSNQKHVLPFGCITKIYLSKKKSGYWSAIIGQLLFIHETRYILHIITSDIGEIKFTVNAMQRSYFLRLIAMVRSKTDPFQEPPFHA